MASPTSATASGGASERNRRQNLKMATTKATSAQVIQCLAAGGLAALVGLVFMPDIGGGMSPGDLAYYLGIAGMLANPIKKLSDVNARLQRGLAAATEIFEQIDEPAEEDSGALEVDRVAGEIRFEKVSFSYDLARPSVLDKVSFSIAAGQTVALVGKSGAGKTTLANLIARFYQPTGGRILLDGKPLASYRLSCVRRQIALVSQDVTLFNDTLANNIAYGGLAGAGRDAIATAARRAHADEFIDSMPRGLDTIVGDDGVLLSGGQRQRVAIARALLKDAPVLILDEATSSLDAHSERHVQAALEEVMRDRTTILIAHRLSTVEEGRSDRRRGGRRHCGVGYPCDPDGRRRRVRGSVPVAVRQWRYRSAAGAEAAGADASSGRAGYFRSAGRCLVQRSILAAAAVAAGGGLRMARQAPSASLPRGVDGAPGGRGSRWLLWATSRSAEPARRRW